MSYVISGDGTGEEIEVTRVICTKCEHYEFMSPEEASKVDDSTFKCPLCSSPEGVVRVVKNYVKCAACGEVMGPDRKCFCPEENKPLLTWVDNSKNSTTKKISEEIEESKLQGLERKVVRNAKQERLEREKRMDENLQKLVELLLKKEGKDALQK